MIGTLQCVIHACETPVGLLACDSHVNAQLCVGSYYSIQCCCVQPARLGMMQRCPVCSHSAVCLPMCVV